MFSFVRICNFTTYVLIYLPLKCNWISIIRSYLAWPNKAFYWENGTLGAASISPFHLQKIISNGLVTFRFFHVVGLPVFLVHSDVSFGRLQAMESTQRSSKGEESAPLLYVISLRCSAFVEHMKSRRGIVWISLKENKPWSSLSEAQFCTKFLFCLTGLYIVIRVLQPSWAFLGNLLLVSPLCRELGAFTTNMHIRLHVEQTLQWSLTWDRWGCSLTSSTIPDLSK